MAQNNSHCQCLLLLAILCQFLAHTQPEKVELSLHLPQNEKKKHNLLYP